ncbi:uncharacterized protein B0I36DRAFT_337183 [Microdochium trichocladiopsis]|uniref:Uncharacterized protein n=1 Tax=Microdochium trichocladiopsis TaxID=1682393 RepID=A0A9P8XTJ8_9PEZI|nr:uncharacterized protein B0I36DRAFT_337183 [Microdochium trichocladiopsis]KAH7016278.1 hypothetical protein B0I36DRAFT_337183 [Microdochium trichocladiopsis]
MHHALEHSSHSGAFGLQEAPAASHSLMSSTRNQQPRSRKDWSRQHRKGQHSRDRSRHARISHKTDRPQSRTVFDLMTDHLLLGAPIEIAEKTREVSQKSNVSMHQSIAVFPDSPFPGKRERAITRRCLCRDSTSRTKWLLMLLVSPCVSVCWRCKRGQMII